MSGSKEELEHTQVQTTERKSWLPFGRSECIVLSLCWAFYSIFVVLAYRNGGPEWRLKIVRPS